MLEEKHCSFDFMPKINQVSRKLAEKRDMSSLMEPTGKVTL